MEDRPQQSKSKPPFSRQADSSQNCPTGLHASTATGGALFAPEMLEEIAMAIIAHKTTGHKRTTITQIQQHLLPELEAFC